VYKISIIETINNLIRLKTSPPIFLVTSAEIKEETDQANAAARAIK